MATGPVGSSEGGSNKLLGNVYGLVDVRTKAGW